MVSKFAVYVQARDPGFVLIRIHPLQVGFLCKTNRTFKGASSWLSLGNILRIFAYCGLVGNPHLTAKQLIFAPLPASTKS